VAGRWMVQATRPSPVVPKLARSPTGVLDADCGSYQRFQADWLEVGRRRDLRRLARFQGLAADGSGPAALRPWAKLGVEGGVAAAAVGGGAGGILPPDSGRSWRLRSSASLEGGSRRSASPRTDECPPSRGCRSLLASSHGGPPATGSTSMSSVWRRAISTPALGNSEGRDTTDEAWQCGSDGLGQEELARLVEHVHGRVLRERRRRQLVEAELGAARGNAKAPSPTDASPAGVVDLIGARRQTPAAHRKPCSRD